uniref:Uncharacterized protein n=1 Tax=uncultured Alphaproteobacteria bacterium TaxID=91750 RepID=A0A6G8F2I8_9PROT|nr:hypothetical protein PlAlph_4120 [uncultured Alphaproteobacteria bacterium]
MRKFILSILLLIVIVGYAMMHDRKKGYAPINGSSLISFTERINGRNLVGICDSNNVVLREARYSYVDGLDGFVIGYDDNKEDIDIFLSDGDSVLCDVRGKHYVFETGISVPHLLVTDQDKQEYIVLQNGQVVGPGENLSVCLRQKRVISRSGNWGVLSFDNNVILQPAYQKIIFVNKVDSDEEGENSGEKADYLLTFRGGRWQKFSSAGAYQDTVSASFAESLLQNPSCEMQTGNAVFSVCL